LIREKVEFALVDKPPRKPFIRLMRTETLIPLPAKWQDHLPGADLVRDWEKRKLLEK